MKRIFVVDDELDIAEALETVLETEGYSVRTCPDGEDCLQALDEETPDLVLLDIMMPRLNGYGVLDRLEKAGRQMPVLLMSAVRPADLGGYRDQVVGFMQKPFSLDTLLDRVADLVDSTACREL